LKTIAKVILSYQTAKSNLYKYRMRVFIFVSFYTWSGKISSAEILRNKSKLLHIKHTEPQSWQS